MVILKSMFYINIFLILFVGCTAYKTYDNYQVLQTSPLDELGLRRLAPLMERSELDFWSTPRVGRSVSIMVCPEHVAQLHRALQMMHLNPAVLIPDVGVTVRREREEILRLKNNADKKQGRAPPLDRFLTYEEIQVYLDEVVAAYPTIASIINIGTSYEGRALRVLRLSSGPGKAGMFFDSAIHAREWAGPPVALFAINELTENLATNQAILDMADFYFLPVANPDGYSYTWSTERLWRKTRSPNNSSSCRGTDGNRNFDWQWAAGGAVDPCENVYAGSSAFSESEVASMASFIASEPSIALYMALHSYGSTLLFPWGGTTELAPNHDQHIEVGNEAADAIRAIRGTSYAVQPISAGSALIYSTSTDWAYGAGGAQLSWTIELPGGGESGFELPPSEILPVATETWEALKVFASTVAALP